jgi:quercetin dioxygenase-like cupin family protein
VGVKKRRSVEGVPEESRLLITKIAHIKKGRSIPPHGHSNMVSAFLCISGRFDVRLYDRLEDRDDAMVVRQTTDLKETKPGTWSSISDYRNNVHWLTATTHDSFLFTSKLIRLEKGREFRGRINIDVKRGRVLGTNTLLASKISSQVASERY